MSRIVAVAPRRLGYPSNFEIAMVDLTLVPEAAIRKTTLQGLTLADALYEQDSINHLATGVPSGFVAIVIPGNRLLPEETIPVPAPVSANAKAKRAKSKR